VLQTVDQALTTAALQAVLAAQAAHRLALVVQELQVAQAVTEPAAVLTAELQ